MFSRFLTKRGFVVLVVALTETKERMANAVKGASSSSVMSKISTEELSCPTPVSWEALARASGPAREKDVCRFFVSGRCRYGESCWHLHPDGAAPSASASELVNFPPPVHTNVCAFYLAGTCKFREYCLFPHDRKNTEPPPTTQSS